MTLPNGPLDIRKLVMRLTIPELLTLGLMARHLSYDTKAILQEEQKQQTRHSKQDLATQKRRRRLTADVMERLRQQENQ